MRRLTLAAVLLALVGCGRRSSNDPAAIPDAVPDGGIASGRVADMGQWSKVGNVKVRILKAAIRKPVLLETLTGKEKLGASPELHLWIAVANDSAAKKMEFSPWTSSEDEEANEEREAKPADVVLKDDKGNSYRLLLSITEDLKENFNNHAGNINPGDEPFVIVHRFQRPVSAATELRLSALPPVENPPAGRHELRIPASAWAR